MLFSDKKQALRRLLLGGVLGVTGYLLLSFLTQPGALFTGSLRLDFTFCYNSQVPETLGAALGLLLWFAFGAEIGVATLPFADDGPALVCRTLLHFAIMAATLSLWVLLNFQTAQIPFFLLLLALIYLLIWLGRWVGWYAEADAIRKKLGLAPAHSLFHWREILPYLPFALVLCWAVPGVIRLLDPADVPVLSALLLPYVLLPAGGLASGLTLGRRQGLCPLYAILCGLLYLPTVFILYNQTALFHCVILFAAVFLGSGLGAVWRRKGKREAAA